MEEFYAVDSWAKKGYIFKLIHASLFSMIFLQKCPTLPVILFTTVLENLSSINNNNNREACIVGCILFQSLCWYHPTNTSDCVPSTAHFKWHEAGVSPPSGE